MRESPWYHAVRDPLAAIPRPAVEIGWGFASAVCDALASNGSAAVSCSSCQEGRLRVYAERAIAMVKERIRSYRDLEAWRVAMDLTDALYDLAGSLPDTERYGLRTQIRRAAVSVPSNIAEGQAYGPGRRYAHHVRISLGSLGELGTLLEVAARRGYLSRNDVDRVGDQLARSRQLLHGLLRSIGRTRIGSALLWLALLVPPAGLLLSLLNP